jgi:hypothetical protein
MNFLSDKRPMLGVACHDFHARQKSSAQEVHFCSILINLEFLRARISPSALCTVLTVLVDVLDCVLYGKRKSVGYNKKCVDTFLK